MSTRRDFLKRAGVLVGGAVLLRPSVALAAARRRPRAFPTAFGFGAQTKGAFGLAGVKPILLRVNSLLDPTDPGKVTLRDALMNPSPRIVIFDVGGYIDVKTDWGTVPPYFYVAGQTAPGGGICLRNAPTYTKNALALRGTHDGIIRHMRFRPGLVSPVGDSHRGLAILDGSYNIVIDHCSASWGIDVNVTTGSGVHDVAIQWCLIAEGLNNAGHPDGSHSMGLNHAYGNGTEYNFTDHHNLIAHCQFRCPQVSVDKVEVYNHIVYHMTKRGINVNANPDDKVLNPKTRLINSYFKRLENYRDGASQQREIDISDIRGPSTNIYVNGNVGPSRPLDTGPELESVDTADRNVCQALDTTCGGLFPHPTIRLKAHAAREAYVIMTSTRSPAVGATKPRRDAVDTRIIDQVLNGTGGLINDPAQVGGHPLLASGTPPVDSDNDGIPDAWAVAQGLNPKDPTHATRIAQNGYSHLENYLNQLAGDEIP